MNILTVNKPIMIFRYDGGDFVSYSCCISSRRLDESYCKKYVRVKFGKGISVPNRALIRVDDGFISTFGTDGYEQLVLVVTKFEVVENEDVKKD